MLPVSHAIFAAAGHPSDEAWTGDDAGRCRLCAAEGVGRPFEAWIKPTFTDHDILHAGSIICTACLFCAQERTCRWLADHLGKEKGQRMRNYSHFVAAGHWHPLTKAEKPRMLELLLAGTDVAVIADSGQKHIIFRARPGWWQFEIAPAMRPDPERLSRLHAAAEDLYAAGATKAELVSGSYSSGSIYRIGAERWRAGEAVLAPDRGSAMLALAVFLTQKRESHDA